MEWPNERGRKNADRPAIRCARPRIAASRPRCASIRRHRPRFNYLTAYVEACDGIGLVRTLDEARGIIECWVMADYVDDFDRQIEAIKQDWPIQPMDRVFE